jgi:hypothetical protein
MLKAPYNPVPVSDVEVAFPAMALDIMPEWDAIPEEYQDYNTWSPFFMEWFTKGLPADVEFHMAGGIDGNTAFRHLSVILGSYAPRHQHKEAAFTFLCSLWFTKVVTSGHTYEEKS